MSSTLWLLGIFARVQLQVDEQPPSYTMIECACIHSHTP